METTNNIALFSVSFKQGFVSPKVPIATFHQGDKRLNFLLDTGSDRNVIDINILNSIVHTPIKIEGQKNTLTGLGGKQEVGLHSITFSCENEDYTANFLAADLKEAFGIIEDDHSICLHGIIGSAFLREHNIVLDFTTLTAYSKS